MTGPLYNGSRGRTQQVSAIRRSLMDRQQVCSARTERDAGEPTRGETISACWCSIRSRSIAAPFRNVDRSTRRDASRPLRGGGPDGGRPYLAFVAALAVDFGLAVLATSDFDASDRLEAFLAAALGLAGADGLAIG